MKNISKNLKITGLFLISSILLMSCSEKKSELNANEGIINVKVATPTLPEGKGFFSASGQIEASQFAAISTRQMGYISQIFVKVGDNVKKGQPLIHVNNTDMEARKAQATAGLNQAKARFNIAEKDYNRFKTLFEQNSAQTTRL